MPAVDTDALRKLMADLGGDPAVMRELLGTFLGEAPRIVQEMRQALAKQDQRTLHRSVHSLKSTSATFGAHDLSRMCRELESDTEKQIPPDAAERAARIESEWERVRAELAAWSP